MSAPDLFSSHFQRDHFIENSEARTKILRDIESIKDYFETGMQVPQHAANYLFALFIATTDNTDRNDRSLTKFPRDPQKAEVMLCHYLNEGRQSGFKDKREFIRTLLGPDAARTIDGDWLISSHDAIGTVARSVIGDTNAGPEQHIRWLNNIVEILHGNGDTYIERRIGPCVGAMDDDYNGMRASPLASRSATKPASVEKREPMPA